MTVPSATHRGSTLRVRLGAALQKHRQHRGLTQARLAESVGLSLKYLGEIERGEANTTLEVVERLAAALEWDPMEALEGLREPLSEGVRVHLLEEVQNIIDRLKTMARWLHALDPALRIPDAAATPGQTVERQNVRGRRPQPRK